MLVTHLTTKSSSTTVLTSIGRSRVLVCFTSQRVMYPDTDLCSDLRQHKHYRALVCIWRFRGTRSQHNRGHGEQWLRVFLNIQRCRATLVPGWELDLLLAVLGLLSEQSLLLMFARVRMKVLSHGVTGRCFLAPLQTTENLFFDSRSNTLN